MYRSSSTTQALVSTHTRARRAARGHPRRGRDQSVRNHPRHPRVRADPGPPSLQLARQRPLGPLMTRLRQGLRDLETSRMVRYQLDARATPRPGHNRDRPPRRVHGHRPDRPPRRPQSRPTGHRRAGDAIATGQYEILADETTRTVKSHSRTTSRISTPNSPPHELVAQTPQSDSPLGNTPTGTTRRPPRPSSPCFTIRTSISRWLVVGTRQPRQAVRSPTRPTARPARSRLWRISGADARRDRRPAVVLARYFCNRCLEESAACRSWGSVLGRSGRPGAWLRVLGCWVLRVGWPGSSGAMRCRAGGPVERSPRRLRSRSAGRRPICWSGRTRLRTAFRSAGLRCRWGGSFRR